MQLSSDLFRISKIPRHTETVSVVSKYFMSKFGYGSDYDLLAKTDPEKIQIHVEDYVMELKKLVNSNSIASYVYPLQSFLDANNIELKWKKIKVLYLANVRKDGKLTYTTKEIKKLLGTTTDLRM